MLLITIIILSHILFIGGCYLVASGITVAIRGSASAKQILSGKLFWGLFMILGGLCMVFSPWVLPALRQALS